MKVERSVSLGVDSTDARKAVKRVGSRAVMKDLKMVERKVD